MWKLRHWLLVWQGAEGHGTIAQLMKWFGPFDDRWTPVQMWNQRGQWLRQPYPDPPRTYRSPKLHINVGVWFVHVQHLPPQFVWAEVTESEYARVVSSPWCFQWNGERAVLRPGHRLNDDRTMAECQHIDYLKRSHTAFGGMPVYQIRKEFPKRTPADFPAILAAGLFNPWYRETPRPRVSLELQTQSFSVSDIMSLHVAQRHRLQVAPAVTVIRDATGLRPQLTGFIRGVGAN